MTSYDYLIVGGGMTADAAVRGIRKVDSTGSIGMLCAEGDPPYNRPPLSKGLWKDEKESSIWRETAAVGATLHLETRATQLDTAGRRVTDANGEEYTYGKLLLATGGRPRRLGAAGKRIIYFRTRNDYQRLRKLASRGANIGVVGAGFIGCEIAAALTMNGVRVTLLFPEDGLCSRVFPAGMSQHLVGYYRDKGVRVRPGDAVKSVVETAEHVSVQTSQGKELQFDALVAGLGIIPDVDLAETAGLGVDNGITVNARLQTSDPNVFAAGDVARYYSPALGGSVRVEHEDNANTMGDSAGRSMAGEELSYEHLASFYSDLFELGYEAVGDVNSSLRTFEDWKKPNEEGVVYYLADSLVRGVLLVNTWGKVDEAREVIASRSAMKPSDLKGRITS